MGMFGRRGDQTGKMNKNNVERVMDQSVIGHIYPARSYYKAMAYNNTLNITVQCHGRNASIWVLKMSTFQFFLL